MDGAGQGQAAEVLRRQVEALRRLNWHPVGGFCLERLPDGQDAEAALRQACAPVIVTATWPGGPVLPGPELTFDLHVVTAAGRSIAGATLEAVLRWPGGGRRWTFAGDACAGTTFVGRTRARAQAPHGPVPGDAGTGTAGTSADGWVELELELKGPSGLLMASNRYRSVFGVP